MIFNKKNIYEALPADSDNYRKDYAEGMQNYINRIEKKRCTPSKISERRNY